MKKKLFFIFLCLFVCPYIAKAEDMEYTLYNTDITINKDRTLDVKEEYDIYFSNNKTGINRILNTKLTQIDPNYKKTNIDTRISNISSTEQFETTNKDGNTIINLIVNGEQDKTSNYNLSYKYNLGRDLSSNDDEVYFDIVSNVPANISNLTFTINLPDLVDDNQFYFSIDNNYQLTGDDISYTIEGNKIIGSLNRLLEKNQKFSIYMTFPNGYFVNTTDNFNYINYFVLIVPIITLLITIFIWFKYGRGNTIKVIRTETIPNNFDPAEIGYLYKGKCQEMDLTTNLIYLANRGYLKVIENDDGYKLGKENSFKIVKLKDYDENNAAQELLFINLFREKDVVELQDIEYKFADTFKEAKSMLDNEDNTKKLFFMDISSKKLLSILLIIISVMIINFNPIRLFLNNILLVPIVYLVYILGLYVLFLSNTRGITRYIIGIGLLGATFYITISPLLAEKTMLLIYIVGTMLVFMSCILYTKLPIRTKYGNQKLSEIYGLKYFIENISVSDLEEKIKENNNFFHEMLPYAYVLDDFEEWLKKGRKIITTPPEWYVPSAEFSITNYEKFIKNFLYTTTLVMMKKTYTEFGNMKYENDKVKLNLND